MVILLLLLLQDAIANLLAKASHPLEFLTSKAFFGDAQAFSAGATGGLRQVLEEVRWQLDGLQLRKLGLSNWGQVVLLEDLIVRLESAHKV